MSKPDFKKDSVRATCAYMLIKAIEYCNEHGFEVIVASDPEGNAWHTINPKNAELAQQSIKDGYIAIGVFKEVDESEAFDLTCKCFNPKPLQGDKKTCKRCYREL